MHISRLRQDDGTFYCNSCSNCVIDMRKMSEAEIRAIADPKVCGILTSDQLTGQQPMSRLGKAMFLLMTVLSLLGFSVKPVSAQAPPQVSEENQSAINTEADTRETKTEQPSNAVTENASEDNKNRSKKAKAHKRRKPKRGTYRAIGCPSF